MQSALHLLLDSYLEKENILLNREELKLQLLSHPSYPSLHALTGVLDHYNIENLALEVPSNTETLEQLPKNFIAHISANGSSEFVLVGQHKDGITLFYESKKTETLSKSRFLELWGGIILALENDGSLSLNMKNRFNSRAFFAASTILFLLAFIMTNTNFDLFYFTQLVLALTGVAVSALIVQQELGYNSATLNKICGNSKTTSCNEVLKSKGAQLFGVFKLSDVSLIYFLGLMSFLLFGLFLKESAWNALMLITFLAVLITIYSIYYQYRVVKKWCTLCLGIVAVLWLQCCSVVLLANFSLKSIVVNPREVTLLFFSFLLNLTLWMLLKPLLSNQQSFKKLSIDHLKFKRNFGVFNALLNKDKSYNTNLIDKREIVLGNPDAVITGLLVTNPACFYCKKAHSDVEAILKTHFEAIKLIIRFNVADSTDNNANKIATRLMEMFHNHEPELLVALDDAYGESVVFEKWLDKWSSASDTAFEEVLNKQRAWCHENAVNFTPAFFVNGKAFPREYERSDLKYFIEDLLEEQKLMKTSLNDVQLTDETDATTVLQSAEK